jgi:hypothetical protein
MLHRLVIFKNPLEEEFPERKQLRIEIRNTVIHELAHHFGWTDRDLGASTIRPIRLETKRPPRREGAKAPSKSLG